MTRQGRQIVAALRHHLDGGDAVLPPGTGFLWSAFKQLSDARTWHAHGPNPITYPEIEAFCRLLRVPLEPHHVETIRRMDQVWLSATLADTTTTRGEKVLPRVSRHAITPQLIDAMFP